MKLIVLQVVLLAFGALFLIIGAGEPKKFNRVSDLITGVALYVLLFITMYGGA